MPRAGWIRGLDGATADGAGERVAVDLMLWCTVKERGPPMKLPLPSVGAGTLVVGSQPEPLHSWRV